MHMEATEDKPKGMSEMDLSKKSGVAQKTINNILRKKTAANIDTVDALAAVFGLNLWHLIMPDLPEELIKSKSIEKLYSSYVNSSNEGRDLIERIAEREAAHTSKK